jgi:FMN phosphatase YigB (HAD superfamily)
MIYCFDLDGTLCDISSGWNKQCYDKSYPKTQRIQKVNSLYDKGNKIIIETARGSVSGKDWHQVTEDQLKNWGVKYHVLRTGTKHAADHYIDDKAINASEFFENE